MTHTQGEKQSVKTDAEVLRLMKTRIPEELQEGQIYG